MQKSIWVLTLTLALLNPCFSNQEDETNLVKAPSRSIIDITALSTLSEEQKKILRKESGYILSSQFLGKIKSEKRMAGFDVYELESATGNAIIIVKNGYIRGGFTGDYSAIYPESPLATLDLGPFISYSDLALDKGVLTYTDGDRIYIDYGLNGVDLIRDRLKTPEIPFPGDYLINSFTSEVFNSGHKCLAVPSVNNLISSMPLACCRNLSSNEVDLYHISRSSEKWEALTSEHPGWQVLESVQEKCRNTYTKYQDEKWLPVDSFTNH